jgi:ribonuclease BN (tRNA processing enzyme)
MRGLDFTFIGTGNAFAPNGSCYNGFLVGERVLFEAPPTAVVALNRLGVDLNELETIVISHHHGDHFLGLPFILLQWKYYGRTKPARIVGPPGTRGLAEDIGTRVYPGLFDIDFEIEWVEARPGQPITAGGLHLEPVEVKHDMRLDWTLGYGCELDGRRFAYTGDSAYCDGVIDLARHSEVLVSECASLDETIDVHMNLRDDIPRVRAAMRPESQLILTHLGPNITDAGLPNTLVAKDFERYHC